jgi:hypothetical protein
MLLNTGRARKGQWGSFHASPPAEKPSQYLDKLISIWYNFLMANKTNKTQNGNPILAVADTLADWLDGNGEIPDEVWAGLREEYGDAVAEAGVELCYAEQQAFSSDVSDDYRIPHDTV